MLTETPFAHINEDLKELNDFLSGEAKRLNVAMPKGGLPDPAELTKCILALD